MGVMFKHIELKEKDDYFKPCSKRETRGVFFCRLTEYNQEVQNFLARYLEAVKQCGVFISEKIQNPTEQQLDYFEEMIGKEFRPDPVFLITTLEKWLPRLDEKQRDSLADALFRMLNEMKAAGKNDYILKNGYTKFMCWFYYKFERILTCMGGETLPKILFEGYVNDYELRMLYILASAGCDVLLVQYRGDQEYLRIDPAGRCSQLIREQRSGSFPDGFSIHSLQRQLDEVRSSPKIRVEAPDKPVSTNTWLTGELLADSLKEMSARGRGAFYYNMFVRIRGAADADTFLNELFRWKLKVEAQRRVVLIQERMIRVPNMDETQKVPRKNYKTPEALIADLTAQLSFPQNKELELLARNAFINILREEAKREETNLNRLSNRAICLLCWANRFVPVLFPNWKIGDALPVFLLYGVCSNENEAVLLRFFSKLPVDVLELCPDLTLPCKLEDPFLFDRVYEQSLPLEEFPAGIDSVKFRTTAYGAERELDQVLYQDTGLYRSQQFKKSIPLQIQTTYEEISILWDQEAKYRPNFEVLSDKVMVPVICAKISGVPGGNTAQYWQSVSSLAVDDTIVVYDLPYISDLAENPIKPHVTKFIKDGRVLFDKIKAHPAYRYGFIREEMQDHMLDKIQECIDRRIIGGTLSRGTEFTILATALNLDKDFLRLIQKYDFTKKIPKLIIISSGEVTCSLADSILVAYLSLIGFDIAVFTPTGYQNVEANYTQPLLTEHQVGDYMYDLRAPDLKRISKGSQRESLMGKLFGRTR